MQPTPATPPWGDQGDGTYRNPILPGDYCDPDVVRDGDRYYMITSSFQLHPGMPILESSDLVNWRTIAHAIPEPAALDPDLGWQRMAGYNVGVYAGSLRKLEWLERDASGALVSRKRWFVHTTLYTAGFVVATADDIRGPWSARFMEDRQGRPLRALRWDDPCPYWEFHDDGTLKAAWLIASKLPGAWYLHTFRLSLDGIRLLDGDLDAMNTEGDTTRRRAGDDPRGALLHRHTGAPLRETRGLDDGHQAEINAAGDLLSVLHAAHLPDREGTVTHDYFSAEAAKLIRFGPETVAGRSTFTGRHGPDQRVCDYVYLYHSEYWDGFRMPVLRRAKSIYGDKFDSAGRYLGPGGPADPGVYETQRLLVDLRHPVPTREPNQGGFVDVPAHLSTDGREHWYWLTHHGEKEVYPECRPTSLLPVTWIDGWPFPGDPPPGDNPRSTGAPDVAATPYDGSGLTPEARADRHHPHQPLKPFVMRWHAPKPPLRAARAERARFQDSDDFASATLSPNWLWNHAPRPGFWSLTARPGWLRLHAFATADRSDSFFQIRNVLSQGYVATPFVLAETRLDLAGLRPGQEAGLAHFDGGKHHASLGVYRHDDGRFLLRYNQRSPATPVPVSAPTILLRTEIGPDRVNRFRYSLDDGELWHDWPDRYALRSGGHRGDRIGLYTYNHRAPDDASPDYGYADFDYFRYDYDHA
ncbi:MAG: family 43 glycosylhydrolase [Opitutaceae bacterium]|nr:family 43 glycosylhydrolase [Opitutaceae bacterium]